MQKLLKKMARQVLLLRKIFLKEATEHSQYCAGCVSKIEATGWCSGVPMYCIPAVTIVVNSGQLMPPANIIHQVVQPLGNPAPLPMALQTIVLMLWSIFQYQCHLTVKHLTRHLKQDLNVHNTVLPGWEPVYEQITAVDTKPMHLATPALGRTRSHVWNESSVVHSPDTEKSLEAKWLLGHYYKQCVKCVRNKALWKSGGP